MLERALAINDKVFGSVHPSVASTLNELGHIAVHERRYNDAQADFARGPTVFTGPLTVVMSATGTTTSSLTQAQYETIQNNLFVFQRHHAPTVAFPAGTHHPIGLVHASQVPVAGSVSASDHSNITAISCTDSLCGRIQGTLSGGGTATATATLSVTGNGAHSITCTATDALDNTGAAPGSANTASINIDSTPPSISGARSPAANFYGWNDTSVVVSFTCPDAISGIASCSAPPR